MKKLILLLSISIFGCTSAILKPNEYKVIDTLDISKNGFGMICGYETIVKVNSDSSLHYAYIDKNGDLTSINFKRIKTQ